MRSGSLTPGRSSACGRARVWAALSVDGTLSQIERRALEVHLRRCEDCRSFSDSVRGFTDEIRESPLVQSGLRGMHYCAPRVRRLPRGVQVLTGFATVGSVALAFVLGRESAAPTRILTAPEPRIPAAGLADDTVRIVRALRNYSVVRTVERATASEAALGRPGVQAG